MSIPALSNTPPTITGLELHAAAALSDIRIASGSDDETTYRQFASSFDTACREILSLPPYLEPRLAPIETSQARHFLTASPACNKLNAWSQKCTLEALRPVSNKLKGKTIALKANISIAGADLNIGTHRRFFHAAQYYVPSVDASVTRRVLEAGGTVVGTGTCENFSLSALSVTAETGPVRNAWDSRRATGGSTSGCAALLSVKDVRYVHRLRGLRRNGTGDDFGGSQGDPDPFGKTEAGVDMAVGGDQGGSIRVPAHFSGIYGLKPTFGLVPYTGIASLLSSIDHVGPMARSVRDVALLLEVLAGADGIDYRQSPWTPLRERVPAYATLLDQWKHGNESAGNWTAQQAGRGLRVGVLKEGWETVGFEEGVARATRAAVQRFRDIGAEVVDISIPLHKLGPSLWAVSLRHNLLACLTNQPSAILGFPMPGFEPLGPRSGNSATSQEEDSILQQFFDYISPINPAISNALLNAPLIAQKYGSDLTRKAQMHIHELTAAVDDVFATEQLDVIVLPVTGKAAPLISSSISTAVESSPDTQASASASPSVPTAADSSPPGNPDLDPYKNKTSIRTSLTPLEAAGNFVGLTLNTATFNLTGHPALSFPCGWAVPGDADEGDAEDHARSKLTGGRMPVGLQVVGRKHGEVDVLKAALAWEVRGRAIDEVSRPGSAVR